MLVQLVKTAVLVWITSSAHPTLLQGNDSSLFLAGAAHNGTDWHSTQAVLPERQRWLDIIFRRDGRQNIALS